MKIRLFKKLKKVKKVKKVKKAKKLSILAIDVGLLHLSIVKIELAEDYLTRPEVILETEITFCDLIDITELVSECRDPMCELYHDKIICDYMMHLFKKFKSLFESVQLILIERQPPTGLVAVQELIMREYRNKSKLISPTAMLNFFGILHYEYLERKVLTEKIATEYLGSLKVFVFNERRHDMADAFCILYYHLSLERKKYQEIIEQKEFEITNKNYISNLQQYVYKG